MASIFDMTAYGIRQEGKAAQAGKKVQNLPANKVAAAQAVTAGLLNGGDAAALQNLNQVNANPKAGEAMIQDGAPTPFSQSNSSTQLADALHTEDVKQKEWQDSTTYGGIAKKAIANTWIESAVLDASRRDTYEPDPNFDYTQHREALEEGLTQRQIDWLRTDSVSLSHAENIRQRALEENEDMKYIFSKGAGVGIASMLSAGVLDPAGIVAGVGIGKIAQVAGVGSRALIAADRVGAGVASFAAENAAVGVTLEAAQRASGKYVTAGDYVKAAGMGAVLGVAMSPFAIKGVRAAQSATEEGEAAAAIVQAGERASTDLRTQAAEIAGPGASEQEIAREVQRLQIEHLSFAERARTAELPASERVFPDITAESSPDGTRTSVTSRFASEDEAALFGQEIGTDLMSAEPAKASMINEVHKFARDYVEANPVDEARLNTVLSKMGKLNDNLASTGQLLLQSEHPVARMYAQLVLENTTGAGGRRTTAAVDKAMTEHTMLEHVQQFEQARSAWARSEGVSWWRNKFGDEAYHRFNRELALYREQLNKGLEPKEVHPAIKQASDMLDAGYGQALREQKAVRVPGHDSLPATSRGYFPHRLSPRKVSVMTNEQQRALAGHFREQLNDVFGENFDADKAAIVANRIVNRMRAEAEAGVAHNINLRARESDRLVEEALREAGIEQTAVEQILSRMYRKGPGHTRHRLNFDLSAEVRDPESGQTFQLLDFYDTDQLSLYRQYSTRVAGEMALAKRGIPGREGLDVIRESMLYGRNGEKLSGERMERTLQAFDQTATEMLGTRYGKVSGFTRADSLNNLRMLASMTQLPGMGWNQFGEFANLIPALGFRRMVQGIGMLPRMLREISRGAENPMLKDLDSVVGKFGNDHMIQFPFHDVDDTIIRSGESLGLASRAIRAGSAKMRTLTLWRHIAAAQTRGTAELIVRKAMKYIKSGKEDAALDDMGIDAAMRADLLPHMDKIATFDNQGRLESLKLDDLDPNLVHRFATAVNRGAKQIIQETFAGETGKWAHDDLLKLFTQYRTFGITSMEKQWGRVAATQGSIKALGLMMGTMSLAVPVVMARAIVSSINRPDRDEYLAKQLSPYAMARATLNYSSLSGLLGDMLDAGAAGMGTVDSLLGTDLAPESAGRTGRGGVTNIFPSLGMADDLVKYAKNPSDVGQLIRLLPGGRLPYMMPLVNSLGGKESSTDSRM